MEGDSHSPRDGDPIILKDERRGGDLVSDAWGCLERSHYMV